VNTRFVVMPNDSMWWILRPEFIAFVDNVVMDIRQIEYEENEKDKSGFHKLVWDRLSVLASEGLVTFEDLKIDNDAIDHDAQCVLDSIMGDENSQVVFVRDMIFAYEYWISFNKMKVDLLPNNQDYSKLIQKNSLLWLEDLNSLKTIGRKALIDRPSIVTDVARNILKKIATMNCLRKHYPYMPMSSLKEYEPFFKYVHDDISLSAANEASVLTHSSEFTRRPNLRIDLPIEPEYNFLRFRLSKKEFWDHVKNTISLYKTMKRRLDDLLDISNDLIMISQRENPRIKVTKDFTNILRSIKNAAQCQTKRSSYLSKTFSGISLLPIPILSTIMTSMSILSSDISQIITAMDFNRNGLSGKGFSSYVSFLESMIDSSSSTKFPQIANDNKAWSSAPSKLPFWRAFD